MITFLLTKGEEEMISVRKKGITLAVKEAFVAVRDSRLLELEEEQVK